MTDEEHRQEIEAIAKKHGFKPDAYNFVIVALAALIRRKAEEYKGGLDVIPLRFDQNEALHWIKVYGFYVYGMLAKEVFNVWGLKKSGDFLKIIDILTQHKLIDKRYIQKKYSESYVKSGFDFSDYSKPDFFDVFFKL